MALILKIDKIDICIVTRDENSLTNYLLPEILEYIPINNLIIETSKPIGLSRYRAIQKVKTKYFAFIDDDIKISKNWFKILTAFIDEDVGCIWGWVNNKGLGKIFDECIFSNQQYRALNIYERWNTSNSIIKTDLIRDWIPSEKLTCFEDWEIGRHIMNKGYKAIFVPCDTIHYKDWIGVKNSALWAGREHYQCRRPTNIKYLKQYIRLILMPFKAVFNRGIFYSIFVAYRNLFYLIGMIQSDYKRIKRRLIK